MKPKRRMSDDDEFYPTLLGTGQANAISDHEPEPEPALWLPMHRSGSRMGGWRKQPIARRRPMGFHWR